MNELINKINFSIKEIEKNNAGINYKVIINVPSELGFIERMKFITETTTERNAHQMKYIKTENGYVIFETDIYLPTKALYHYYFSFEANNNFIYFKKQNNESMQTISRDDMWKLSVNFKVPNWAKGKIMYHIFVDRFNCSDNTLLKEMPNRVIHKSWNEDIIIGPNENGEWNTDFYGGNLQGIIEKLSYIKSLQVSILYLSPIVLSQSNHRYDAADYEKIDSYVGSLDDLKKLCNEAHKLGIRVVLDAVFNHTGNDSKYFNEYNHFSNLGAYQSKDSPYYSFYRKYTVNGKNCFDYWWGMKNLPVCDGNSKEWQDYIYGKDGIIDLWFSCGIDGLRLDVADELSDSFIEGIRRAVKRNKEDGFIIGEVWQNPMRMHRGYLESGKGMDSVMNYQLVDALIRYYKYADVNKLKEKINEIITEYPGETINSLMNFTSTHDITRAINIFGTNEFQYHGEWAWNLNNDNREWQKNYQLSDIDYKRGKDIFSAYSFALTFLPGILSIFYGDEIGMQGMGNLGNRRPFTWHKIDYDLLNLFRYFGKIRNKETFLETASLDLIDINDKYFVFRRIGEKDEALVYISRVDYKVKLILPKSYQNEDILYSLKNSDKNNLDAYGGIVLKKIKKY